MFTFLKQLLLVFLRSVTQKFIWFWYWFFVALIFQLRPFHICFEFFNHKGIVVNHKGIVVMPKGIVVNHKGIVVMP